MDEREQAPADTTPEAETGGPGGFIAGLIVGAALGAGIALLLAPETGKDTRHHLRRRLRAMRKDAARGLEGAEALARRQLRRGRRDFLERLRS